MVQATTPTFTLKLPNTVDLTAASKVIFDLRQGANTIEKRDAELTISEHQVEVALTQAETLALNIGSAKLQLNWVYSDGSRACSNIVSIPVTENLLKAVVE